MKARHTAMLATRPRGQTSAPLTQPLTQLRAPRRAFWALLSCALALSFALPLFTLWQVSARGLRAQACMWPAQPRAGDVAQALVVIPAAAATAEAAEASAGTLVVQVVATMPGMSMQAQQATAALAGRPGQGAAIFSAPISVGMPGAWEARFTAWQAGRSIWTQTVGFRAQTRDWRTLPLSAQAAGAGSPCAAASAVALRTQADASAPFAAEQRPAAGKWAT